MSTADPVASADMRNPASVSERDALNELEQSVSAVLGKMNYYFGTGARTAVSRESQDAYLRVKAARDNARAILDEGAT